MTKIKSLLTKVDRVPLKDLSTHPSNPRKGNVDAVAESLEANQMYRPIVVQQSTHHVIVGNHTYLAAKKLGWTHIDVVYVDVDDDRAKRIMLADNRTADLGTYDDKVLAEVLASLEDVIGTGFTDEDAELIQAALNDTSIDLDSVLRPSNMDSFDAAAFGDEDEDDAADAERFQRAEPGALESASDEMSSVFNIKAEHYFPSQHKFGLPPLKPDMFIEELPTPLETWAGSATKDWPDDVWWLYNYGIDSTSGMRDVSKIVLSFYAWDDYFEGWWDFTDRYLTKAINSRIKYAITPNFSTPTDQPRVLTLLQTYKSRWIGRMMQEVGIKIIPDIEWPAGDLKYIEQNVLYGIPKKLPWIAIQYRSGTPAKAQSEEDLAAKEFHDTAMRMVIDTLEPEGLFLYAGEAGRDYVKGMNLPCKVHWQPDRLIRLGAQAKNRQRKKTL